MITLSFSNQNKHWVLLLFEKLCESQDRQASLRIGCQDVSDLVGQSLDVAAIDQADLDGAAVVLLHTQALVQLAWKL